MARKVFLSVLGTGFYGKCKYEIQDSVFCSNETRFIQAATLQYLEKSTKWDDNDVLFILLTDKARATNWQTSQNGTRYNPLTKKEEQYEGLEQELSSMNLPFKNKIDHSIPNGANEKEMWKIFKVMYNLIEEGDELYVDLTHSFRYIPMLMMVFCNYVKFLKNIQVKSITYGNYEERKDGIAPIVDITTLSVLQNWTAAADEFISTGSVEKLKKLYLPQIRQRLKNTQGDDVEAQLLNSFIININSLMNEFKLCQGKRLIEAEVINKTRNSILSIEQIETPEPFKPLLDEIRKSIQIFESKENVKHGIAAAKWCCDNGLYQQSITLLQESIVSMVCELVHLDWHKEVKRKYVNNAFNILNDKTLTDDKDHWQYPNDNDLDKQQKQSIIEEIISLPIVNDLASDYSSLTAYRNKINHGTMLEGNGQFKNVDKIVENIEKLTDKIYNITYCTNI